jgi:uncharacterized protein YhbP (UPF0306 family)
MSSQGKDTDKYSPGDPPENSALRRKILRFLARHNSMTLATVDEIHMPHAAAVFFVNHEFEFYFVSHAKTRHATHIMRSKTLAATINKDHAKWHRIKGLQLTGSTYSIEDDEENLKVKSLFMKKFPDVGGFLEPVSSGSSIRFYKFLPHQITLIDNSQGFGHKEHLTLCHP